MYLAWRAGAEEEVRGRGCGGRVIKKRSSVGSRASGLEDRRGGLGEDAIEGMTSQRWFRSGVKRKYGQETQQQRPEG